MYIKELELKNIRSYIEEVVSFNSGITFLSGDIGSGKSSLLQAIEFALLGFKRGDLEGYQLLRSGTLQGEVRLVLFDSKNNNEIEIRRRLKKSKTTNAITQETGTLRINDSIEEFAAQELNTRIFEILNFPMDFLSKDKNLIYRYTIYTAQEQLKEVLFSKAEERLEIIRKLFNIDKYKQLKSVSSLYLNQTREKKKIYELRLEERGKKEKEIAQVEKELKELEEKIRVNKPKEEVLEKNIRICKEHLERLENEEEKTNERLVEKEKKISQLFSFQEQLKKDKEQVEKKEKEIKELKTYNWEEEEKKLNKLEKELKEEEEKRNETFKLLEEKREELKEELIELKKFKEEFEKKKNLQEKLKMLEEHNSYVLLQCKIKDLEKKSMSDAKLEKKEKEFKEKTLSYQEEKSKIESTLLYVKDELQKIVGEREKTQELKECPTCQQEMNETHRKELLANLEKKEKELRDKEEKEEKSKTLLLKEIKDFELKTQEFEKEKKNFYESEERIRSLKEQLEKEKGAFEEIKRLRKELHSKEENNLKENLGLFNKKEKEFELLEEKREQLNKEREDYFERKTVSQKKKEDFFIKKRTLETLKLEITELQKREEELKKELLGLKELEEEIIKVKKEKDELFKKRKSVEEKKEENYRKQRVFLTRLTELETEAKEKRKNLEKGKSEIVLIKNIEHEYTILIQKEKILLELIQPLCDELERTLFTKYYTEFNEAFQYYFKELIEDQELDIWLSPEDFSPLLEQNGYDSEIKNLSGGEKSSLALAYRLALKKIIEENSSSKQILSLLVLDEPTDGFSNEQVNRLGLLLKEETELEQIILVSHDEKIEGIANHHLHVEKRNHRSKII